MTRFFLTAELLIEFDPLIVLLVVGLWFSAYQVVFLAISEEVRARRGGSLYVIGVLVLRLIAPVRFVNITQKIIRGKKLRFEAASTTFLASVGGLILPYHIVVSNTMGWRVFFFIPMSIATHFSYLGRRVTFLNRADYDA